VRAGDLAVLLSNSGQSAEMVRLLATLRRFELTVVALTSNPDSDLARDADLRLLYRVPREACPLRLAPTASTTAALALGDALAMVLLETPGFHPRTNFARLHPAGNLGTALLVKVQDIMRTGEPPAGAAPATDHPGCDPLHDEGQGRLRRPDRRTHGPPRGHPHRWRLPPAYSRHA